MFGKKPGLAPVNGGQDHETNGQVFQVKYGRISRLTLKIGEDRVKRLLLLYEPRSDKPDNFVRIALPDGALPMADEDCLPQHVEGVVIQWAREDADAWMDGKPMRHAHPDCEADDLGQGQVVNVAPSTRVAPPQASVPAPAPASAPVQPEPRPSPEPAPARETPVASHQPPPTVADDPFPDQKRGQAPVGGSQALTEEPISQETGRIGFIGKRAHSFRSDSYECFTVDLITASGSMETFRGTHLEDVVRANGIKPGDSVTILQLPKKEGSKKNRFHIIKH